MTNQKNQHNPWPIIYVPSWEQLQSLIREHRPLLFVGSQTSTVIPYGSLINTQLVSLSSLPKKISWTTNHPQDQIHVEVEGPVTWEELRAFCRSHQRDLPVWPTEESAQVLASAATSATGERSFAFGPFRKWIRRINFYDYQGQLQTLSSSRPLTADFFSQWENDPFPWEETLARYRNEVKAYDQFKNPPFPILNQETDLMIGTEGQLGVIRSLVMETIPLPSVSYFLLKVPAPFTWTGQDLFHQQFFLFMQDWRQTVLSCEFIDQKCWSLLQHPLDLADTFFLEIRTEEMEDFWSHLNAKFPDFPLENVLELKEQEFLHWRKAVPLAINEYNQKHQMLKKGTDVQVNPKDFPELLQFYRSAHDLGLPLLLFGHFGDAHLHLNFLLPSRESEGIVQDYLTRLYFWVKAKKGSPFAEHGVGVLKQNWIRPFYGEAQLAMFRGLKQRLDPYGQFFPAGPMSLGKE